MPQKPYVCLLIVIAIITIPVFGHLDALPLQLWDESRLAYSAVEMSYNHNWLIPTIDNVPDMWSTKPPLMIWLQALTIKLVGINELAIRLPAALAAAGTCLLIFFLFAVKARDPFTGVIATAVLVTTPGYVAPHGIRTGEYDSLLTLLMAGYAIFCFFYFDSGKAKHLYALFACLLLAMLTKGVQSLLFLPGLFLFAVYKKKLIELVQQKHVYIGVATVLFFGLGYYLLREQYNPGYIDAVLQNEVGGRYNTVIENHHQDEWYYYDLLTDTLFHDWYLLALPGIAFGLVDKRQTVKDITVLSTILVCSYLLIISFAKTKLDWYMLPMYPFLAILVGLFLSGICGMLVKLESWKQLLSFNMIPYIFLFIVFALPYQRIVSSVHSKNSAETYMENCRKEMKQFLKDVLHREHNIDGCALTGVDGQDMACYYRIFKLQGRPIGVVHNLKDIDPNGKLVLYTPELKQYINWFYNYSVLRTYGNIFICQLNGKK